VSTGALIPETECISEHRFRKCSARWKWSTVKIVMLEEEYTVPEEEWIVNANSVNGSARDRQFRKWSE
jgi:hypothetical protein